MGKAAVQIGQVYDSRAMQRFRQAAHRHVLPGDFQKIGLGSSDIYRDEDRTHVLDFSC
jgi:hypothetical protein